VSGIDARAVVDPAARIGRDVEIGAFSVIGSGVELHDGVRVGSHCVIEGATSLGQGCTLSSHVVLGTAPQDLKYRGEPTRLEVGARNAFREFVTVNRGTPGGGGLTRVGDDNLFMTGAHVAHDCRVGSGTVFANNATLAGHVEVGDGATVGAFSAVHQFCRVGRQAFLGGFTVVTQDALPFMKTVGTRGDVRCYGPNRIGLERRGFSPEVVEGLSRAFRGLRASGGRTPEAQGRVRAELGDVAEVVELLDFVATARESRGFHL
jgi:UDP-N-acetylglucosamine acyltransferase